MADITMPQLGETVTEGTITKWFKSVGDTIAEDETLFEVSTDKVDSEVPSSVSGVVAEILVEEGETVDVGARLAVITEEGAEGEAESEGAKAATAEDQENEVDEVDEGGDSEGGDSAERDSEDAEPDDGQEAAPAKKPASAKEEKPEPRKSQTAASSERGSEDGGGARQVLSPIVRRLLVEHDVDPSSIRGTGRGGRVTRDDVLVHVASGSSQATKASKSEPASSKAPPKADSKPDSKKDSKAPAESRPAAAAAGEADEVIPFSNIRRRTAEHMVRSQATSAHVLTVIEVDYERVDRVRRVEREAWKEEEGFSLTYLPFVARAVIDAIRDFPHVNASVGDDELIVHRQVHLGFAVDLNFEGLIVPVIHDADSKRLRTLAREVADLAARARSRSINADEISGSTFTITNPGSFGTLITAPVINQPQVAIVSTDGVRKRPVVIELPDGSDGIAIHPVGNLAMSFDHRAFDGAYASAFLARCREIIETRDWSQEL